jgi:hypothetical protein
MLSGEDPTSEGKLSIVLTRFCASGVPMRSIILPQCRKPLFRTARWDLHRRRPRR